MEDWRDLQIGGKLEDFSYINNGRRGHPRLPGKIKANNGTQKKGESVCSGGEG
jgi:hypothetical protein